MGIGIGERMGLDHNVTQSIYFQGFLFLIMTYGFSKIFADQLVSISEIIKTYDNKSYRRLHWVIFYSMLNLTIYLYVLSLFVFR